MVATNLQMHRTDLRKRGDGNKQTLQLHTHDTHTVLVLRALRGGSATAAAEAEAEATLCFVSAWAAAVAFGAVAEAEPGGEFARLFLDGSIRPVEIIQ
jgi:hypothetical protein